MPVCEFYHSHTGHLLFSWTPCTEIAVHTVMLHQSLSSPRCWGSNQGCVHVRQALFHEAIPTVLGFIWDKASACSPDWSWIYSIAQAGLQLVSPVPLPPGYWDYRCTAPYSISPLFLVFDFWCPPTTTKYPQGFHFYVTLLPWTSNWEIIILSKDCFKKKVLSYVLVQQF